MRKCNAFQMENLFVVPCAVASFLKVESTGVKFLTFHRKEGKNGVENKKTEKSLCTASKCEMEKRVVSEL